jgi:hypothetical protein
VDVEVPRDVQVDVFEKGEDVGGLVGLLRVSKSTSPVPRFIAANRSVLPLRL